MRQKNAALIDNILRCIDEYQSEHGVSPSTREIASMTQTDCGSISRYLKHMESEGLLVRKGTRCIETRRSKARSSSVVVPLVGRIACGEPIFAEENIEEYLPIPSEWSGADSFFFLRAQGDSMINIGIDDGDLILVRRQDYAGKGDVIVALVDDDATLKRYYPSAGKITLRPENDDLSPIEIDPTEHSFQIQGIAVSVVKSIH